MKKSQIKDISEKSISELGSQLSKTKEDIARLTLEKNSKRLKDVALLSKKRKIVAQLLTFIKQKEIKK
jgi:ribosomal protein L29